MIRIRQIKIDVARDSVEELRKKIARTLNISEKDICDLKIIKKSIDARKKPNIFFIYEVDVLLNEEDSILNKFQCENIFLSNDQKYFVYEKGSKKLEYRPIIVGSGPAGLFCAYFLASEGYKPIILERGEKIESRVETVEKFWKFGVLNEESNVQFGEGGAGTFSDGKLNTMIKDKEHRQKEMLKILVSCGADEEIMYMQHPHLGTDKLRNIIISLREKIISMGGEFYFNTKLTDIEVKENTIKRIQVNHCEWYEVDVLVLALGHSARDTFSMLYNRGLEIISKPFAVGVRVMHSQDMINESQYGVISKKILPPANYKVTYQTSTGRGVYCFCMCPGGYVLNASSEQKRLVINGMSEQKRDTVSANSAIIVTVTEKDYGSEPLSGIEFQRKLEEKAYSLCNGKIPMQLYSDFVKNKKSQTFKSVVPITKGEWEYANLNEILPEFIIESIKEAMPHFDKLIKGFQQDDVILFGTETRTSSPIRMKRSENYISNIMGIYPCGEGAGYAGGITSSSLDGMKIAHEIIKTYTNDFL